MAHYYRIAAWNEYQHYTDRAPPWIKLHFRTLSSRTWVSASDSTRVLAVACMLLASDTGNKIPIDATYIKRVAYLNDEPDFEPLIKSGFLEIIDENGDLLAPARPEKRNKKDREEKNLSLTSFAEFWFAYPKRVGRKKAQAIYTRTIAKDEATPEALLAGAKRYAAECKGKEAQYIAHPATWLNAGRWADDESTGSATVIDLTEAAARERKLHEEALQKLAKGFTWPQFLGPAPGESGCRIASDLLEKYQANWDHFYIKPELARSEPEQPKPLCPPI